MVLKSGFSTLTVALLVSVVGLGLAISSVSKLTGSEREGTSNIQRVSATHCVESAFEIATACIQSSSNVMVDCQQTNEVPLDPSNPASCGYKYSVSEVNDNIVLPKIAVDNSEILALNEGGSSSVSLSWKTDVSKGGNALEVNLLKDDGNGGYSLKQVVYECELSGFTINGASTVSALYDVSTGVCSVNGDISLSGESFIQLSSRFNNSYDVTVVINGSNPPLQGYAISATGVVGQVERYGDGLLLNPNFGRVFNASFMAKGVQ